MQKTCFTNFIPLFFSPSVRTFLTDPWLEIDENMEKTWPKYNSCSPHCRKITWKISHRGATVKTTCFILWQGSSNSEIGHLDVIQWWWLPENLNVTNWIYHILVTVVTVILVPMCGIPVTSHWLAVILGLIIMPISQLNKWLTLAINEKKNARHIFQPLLTHVNSSRKWKMTLCILTPSSMLHSLSLNLTRSNIYQGKFSLKKKLHINFFLKLYFKYIDSKQVINDLWKGICKFFTTDLSLSCIRTHIPLVCARVLTTTILYPPYLAPKPRGMWAWLIWQWWMTDRQAASHYLQSIEKRFSLSRLMMLAKTEE